MKKFTSIVFCFFVLFNSVPIPIFAQELGDTQLDSQNDVSIDDLVTQNITQQEQNDTITSQEILSSQDNNLETQDIEPVLVPLITDGGQSGQVMDNIFIPYVDGQNTDINQDFLLTEIQLAPELMGFNEILDENPIVDYDLMISEVYFDGTNERIEIYNNDNISFSGNLIISGASASNKTILNLVINPQETKIFTDTNVDSILDTSFVFQTNMGFSISDTQSINIQILYSGYILDQFGVDASIVSSLDNKISFHKFIDNFSIVSSDDTHIFNVTSGNIANPGKVYQTIPIVLDPQLKITELYFDGDEERVEITNINTSQAFSGDLSFGGDLSFDVSTQILEGESMIFANDLYAMFETGNNIQIIPSAYGEINFDTGAINLDLIRSGQILDTFYAHETQVQYYDQAETSFEKIGSNNFRTTTVVGLNFDRYYNTNWGIAANPTTYFTTGENLIDVTQSREIPVYTDPLPIDCDDFWDDSTANISEVYYGNNLYSPYVEIRTSDNIYDYYPYIKLEGSALSGIVAFATQESDFTDINMSANKRILISANDQRYSQGRESVYDSNFSLTTGGRLTLYGRDEYEQARQILDIIYLSGPGDGKSLYIGNQTNQCADIFDYQDKFSPGMTIGQSQFIAITPDPIVQYISVGGGGSCNTNTQDVFNSKDNLLSNIQISAVKYFGNLQILKLKNQTDLDISLRDYRIQTLDGETQTIKGNTLFAKSSMSFVGNYGLPISSDYCINLLKGDDVVDRYCRNSITKASILDEENILNQLDFRIDYTDQKDEPEEDLPELSGAKDDKIISNPLQTNTIKILDIDYNPDGSDTDNESITLVLLSGSQVDLSDYKIQYIKDGKSTNKSIDGILTKGNSQIFKGNFIFPNSSTDKNFVVVNLIDKNNYIVDTYLYNPNKITEIPDGRYNVLSVIDGDTIKIDYLGQEFNIRLAGIDAPESSTLRCGKIECFGIESKNYLKNIIENKSIFFETDIQGQQDSFDRFVGYVFLNGENINKKMINQGYAREYSYKNNLYKYRDDFGDAQNYAKSHKLGLWSSDGIACNGQRLCPVEETQNNIDFGFNIENIIYNPDGSDTDNEIIKISMQKGFTVDFADGFYLMINDTRKSLSSYGTISPGETKTLKGSFSFPNTKKTTVSLFNEEKLFDTYIYDPQMDDLLDKELDKEETLTGALQNTGENQFGIDISIVSILPNPVGNDTLGEQIGLLYFRQSTVILSGNEESIQTGTQNIKTLDSLLRSEGQSINLADGFYLKIGDKKTYFKNKIINNNYELISNQETFFIGNFGLPNKAACIEIGYQNVIFDKFCYSQTQEGQKLLKTNGVLSAISTIDFGILNGAKLENIGNQVCLTYGSQKFYCKNMPYSKLSTQKVNQNKLYKEFFDNFENYLKDQRKIMYYDTDIKNYFSLLNEIEKAISDGKSEFIFEGKTFQTSEFGSIYQYKYPQATSIFVKQKLSDFIPAPIKQKYQNLREEYDKYLMKQ